MQELSTQPLNESRRDFLETHLEISPHYRREGSPGSWSACWWRRWRMARLTSRERWKAEWWMARPPATRVCCQVENTSILFSFLSNQDLPFWKDSEQDQNAVCVSEATAWTACFPTAGGRKHQNQGKTRNNRKTSIGKTMEQTNLQFPANFSHLGASIFFSIHTSEIRFEANEAEFRLSGLRSKDSFLRVFPWCLMYSWSEGYLDLPYNKHWKKKNSPQTQQWPQEPS